MACKQIIIKIKYVVHTDAIKKYIVPNLTEQQIKFVYANEADVLNVALFGMTDKNGEKITQNLLKMEIYEIILIYFI